MAEDIRQQVESSGGPLPTASEATRASNPSMKMLESIGGSVQNLQSFVGGAVKGTGSLVNSAVIGTGDAIKVTVDSTGKLFEAASPKAVLSVDVASSGTVHDAEDDSAVHLTFESAPGSVDQRLRRQDEELRRLREEVRALTAQMAALAAPHGGGGGHATALRLQDSDPSSSHLEEQSTHPRHRPAEAKAVDLRKVMTVDGTDVPLLVFVNSRSGGRKGEQCVAAAIRDAC